MQPNMFPPEPNLIAETYRNHIIQLPRRFEKYYDFIDTNEDGIFLLGTSNLAGRIWSGSIWLFSDSSDPPDVDKCIAGLEFESGIAAGKWFTNGKNIVVGADSGALNILSLTPMADVNKQYLNTLNIVCEHDEGITTVDVSSDDTKMLSGSMDMSIKVWDVETTISDKTYECAHSHTVTSACFQKENTKIFISTSTDGDSLIWDMKQEKPASLILRTESGFTACDWVDDNCVVLGASNGTISLVDLRMKMELDRNFCSKRPIHNVSYEKNSELLAVCADDPVVRVFSCSDNLLDNIYECDRHQDFVRGLCWRSPNVLYTCAYDKSVLCHEISVNEKVVKTNSEMEENGETESQKKEEDKEISS